MQKYNKSRNTRDKSLIKFRRESTLMRDRHVLELYRSIIRELGEVAPYVSRSYIYGRIREQTLLSIRTISFIINNIHPDGGGKTPGAY